jgi:hypothetical protein
MWAETVTSREEDSQGLDDEGVGSTGGSEVGLRGDFKGGRETGKLSFVDVHGERLEDVVHAGVRREDPAFCPPQYRAR